MKSYQTIVVAAAALVCGAAFAEEGVVSFQTGANFNTHVQLRQFASILEQRAGQELAKLVLKSANCWLPVINSPKRAGLGDNEIHIVTLEAGRRYLPKAIVERLDAATSDDAFVISAEKGSAHGDVVYIVGKRDIGCYYGANAFLEDYCGFRFFHPGKCGTYMPGQVKVSMKSGAIDFRSPHTKYRSLGVNSNSVKPLDLIKDVDPWMARRTYQFGRFSEYKGLTYEELAHNAAGNQPFMRGSEYMLDDSVPMALFETHPEYFPLVGGKRNRKISETFKRRCLSNPDVLRLCVEQAVRCTAYSPHYTIDYFDLQGGWCECDACRKYGTGTNGVYTVENMVHHFNKDLSEAILAKRPDIWLETNVYLDYRRPISMDFSFDDRFHGVYCPHNRCYAHALDDPKCHCNPLFLKWYDFWRGRFKALGIFDYYCYCETRYAPVEWVLDRDFKRYASKGGLDTWVEDNSNIPYKIPYILCNWQLYYLASKLMWNPSLDAQKLFDADYDLYYGKAAAKMKEYHALRHELWDNAPEHSTYDKGFNRYRYALGVKGAKEKLLGLLDEARRTSPGFDAEQRIKFDRECLETYWIAGWKNTEATYRMRPDTKTPPVDLPHNGDLRILSKFKMNDGTERIFPDGFWTAARHWDGEAIVLSNEMMTAQIDVAMPPDGGKVRLVAEVDGKGTFELSLPGCIRKQGDHRPFKAEKGVGFSKTHTVNGPATVVSEGVIPPDMKAMFYFFGHGVIRMKSVRYERVD